MLWIDMKISEHSQTEPMVIIWTINIKKEVLKFANFHNIKYSL